MTDFVVISDLHANHLTWNTGNGPGAEIYAHYLSAIENIGTKVLLCAGDVSNDIEGWEYANEHIFSKFKHVYLVLGNHDMHADVGSTTEQKIVDLKALVDLWPNVTLLDGEVVDVDGVKIGGCFGWYDGVDDDNPTDRWEWLNTWYDGAVWNWHHQDLRSIAYENVKKMKAVLDQKPDIFITHVAHNACNTNPIYRGSNSNKYFYYTPEEYDLTGVKKIICGHTHDCVKKTVNGYDILCNPFGYIDEEDPQKLNNLKLSDFEFSM